MSLEFIEHNGIKYPSHEAEGNAAQWIMPLAQRYCRGIGVDVGCNNEKWCFPGAVPVDPEINTFHAMQFPYKDLDFLFSSHCLEHIKDNWYNVVDYWLTKIKVGGILFLYLPHKSQTYWHPSSNRKHIHSFDGDEIGEYLRNLGHKVFVGGCDGNHSFCVICEKVDYVSDVDRLNRMASLAQEVMDSDAKRENVHESLRPFYDALNKDKSSMIKAKPKNPHPYGSINYKRFELGYEPIKDYL